MVYYISTVLFDLEVLMDHTLEKILARVQKPGRYVGGEYNAVMKNKDEVDCRFAFCFPDTYEIGMSNLGLRILYGVANEMDGVWCERVFAPWGDMEAEMRREGLPLYALESGDPIAEFDIIGFSMGYEMAYTNVLNMLDLAGLPLRSEDRTELTPIVVAGGTSMYNPEPLSPLCRSGFLGRRRRCDGRDDPALPRSQTRGMEQGSVFAGGIPDPGPLCSLLVRGHLCRGWHHFCHHAQRWRTRKSHETYRFRHGSVLLSGQDLSALHRSHSGPRDARALPRLYPWLPVLSGGLCLSSGPDTLGRPLSEVWH